MAGSKQPKIRELLLPIVPEMIEYLKERAGVRSSAELADQVSHGDVKLDANSLYRFNKQKVLPEKKLTELCAQVGLSPGQTAWLIGHFLIQKYQSERVDLDDQPGEIREPSPRYGEGRLEGKRKAMKAFDFGGLTAEEMYDLNRERNALDAACEEIQVEAEELKARVDRRIDVHVDLVDLFIERAEKALRRAQTSR